MKLEKIPFLQFLLQADLYNNTFLALSQIHNACVSVLDL